MNKIIKISELSGAALDWAAAKCEGFGTPFLTNFGCLTVRKYLTLDRSQYTQRFIWEVGYSTDWAQGGPVIEREKICTCPTGKPSGSLWSATDDTGMCTAFGPTPLIAAMRCYCCAKLGDEVEIPEELL